MGAICHDVPRFLPPLYKKLAKTRLLWLLLTQSWVGYSYICNLGDHTKQEGEKLKHSQQLYCTIEGMH